MPENDVRVSVTDWQHAGEYITYEGYQIFVRQQLRPDKPHLLLIHGFPTAGWDWHKLWPALQAQFSLTAIDMLGFGLTDKPKNLQYSIALQADLHAHVMQRANISHSHLLAHDYGVSVAQELFARQLEGSLQFAIESCVFLNGGLFHGVHKPLLIQHLLASPIGFLFARLVNESAVRRSMRRIFAPESQPDDWELEQIWHLIARQSGQRIAHKIIRYMHERQRFYQRWLQALQQANVPLRLIVGSLDPISGAHLAAAYRDLIPNPDVVELYATGHYPQLETPAGVSTAAEAFWQQFC